MVSTKHNICLLIQLMPSKTTSQFATHTNSENLFYVFFFNLILAKIILSTWERKQKNNKKKRHKIMYFISIFEMFICLIFRYGKVKDNKKKINFTKIVNELNKLIHLLLSHRNKMYGLNAINDIKKSNKNKLA